MTKALGKSPQFKTYSTQAAAKRAADRADVIYDVHKLDDGVFVLVRPRGL